MARPKLSTHSNGKDTEFFEKLEQSFHQFLQTSYQGNEKVKSNEKPDPFSLTGTLPDWALKEYIKAGIIKIDPLPEDWEDLVDEVSVDFHLGNKLRVFTNDGLNTIDTRYTTKEEMENMMTLVELKPGQPFVLTENEFVIATTRERLTLPKHIVGQLHGKSSLARIGVVVHSTAARFDPGWDGCPVLEFGTFLKGKKIVIYEGSPICAFSFEKMPYPADSGQAENLYTYSGSDIPEVSNISRQTVGKHYNKLNGSRVTKG